MARGGGNRHSSLSGREYLRAAESRLRRVSGLRHLRLELLRRLSPSGRSGRHRQAFDRCDAAHLSGAVTGSTELLPRPAPAFWKAIPHGGPAGGRAPVTARLNGHMAARPDRAAPVSGRGPSTLFRGGAGLSRGDQGLVAPEWACPVCGCGFRDGLTVDQLGQGSFRREVHEQVDVVVLAVELDQLAFEVGADGPHDLFHARQVGVLEDLVPVLRHENQVCVRNEGAVSASAEVLILSHKPTAVG